MSSSTPGMTDIEGRCFKPSKGSSYIISFFASAEDTKPVSLEIVSPSGDVEKSVRISIDPVRQRHVIRFVPLSDGDYLVRFVYPDYSYSISPVIEGLSIEAQKTCSDCRKVIAVCSMWADADNYNMFLQSLLIPEITEDYVVASFTFNQPFTLEKEIETELEFSEIIRRFDVAAMVIFAEMLKIEPLISKLIGMGRQFDVPVVVLEHRYPGTINGVYDYSSGFEEMLEHVITHHGITDIKMLAGFEGNEFSLERERIFARRMKEEGIEVTKDDILYGDFYTIRAEQVTYDYLENGGHLPKAFVCANDAMATGVCDALERRGVRVPEDVIVTGFDGARCGKFHFPVITTCAPDLSVIGREILKVLKAKEEGNEDWRRGYDFPINYHKVENGSCGCAVRGEAEWKKIVTDLALDNQDYYYHDIEMGMFSAATVNLDDIDLAMDGVDRALHLWKNQYNFVGLTTNDDYVHSLMRSDGEDLIHREKYYLMDRAFPDYDTFMKRGSGRNVVLVRQIRSNGQCHGYIVSCLEKLSLRDEERFEEFGMYMSIIVNSVLKQSSLRNANLEILRASEHDYLTGLYNRKGFLARCEKMLESGASDSGLIFTLMSVDMDGLKLINDTYGHNEGDKALKILSRALRRFAGKDGICARYGGDEFAIAILSDTNYADHIEDPRELIQKYAAQESASEGTPYNVGASVGAASVLVDSGEDLENIMNIADAKMYEDKVARKKVRRA